MDTVHQNYRVVKGLSRLVKMKTDAIKRNPLTFAVKDKTN